MRRLAREINSQLKVARRPLCCPVIHLTYQATEKILTSSREASPVFRLTGDGLADLAS
jgi:hypothetical protein